MEPRIEVVDQRLTAGRGEEFSAQALKQRQEEAIEIAALDGEDFRCAAGVGAGVAGSALIGQLGALAFLSPELLMCGVGPLPSMPPPAGCPSTASTMTTSICSTRCRPAWTSPSTPPMSATACCSASGGAPAAASAESSRVRSALPALPCPALPALLSRTLWCVARLRGAPLTSLLGLNLDPLILCYPSPTPLGVPPPPHTPTHTIPTGIAEPIRLDANDTGTRSGLGRRQEEAQYTAAENVYRRTLETELQAEEDEERARKREVRGRPPLTSWGSVFRGG